MKMVFLVYQYHHEDVSILMLDRMLSADGGAVREALRADGGIQEQDIVFIKVGGEGKKIYSDAQKCVSVRTSGLVFGFKYC